MSSETIPERITADVWICRACWEEQDDLNHPPDSTPRRGWIRPESNDLRCYCCNAPLVECCAVIRYVDPRDIHPKAYVWQRL